MDWFVKTLEGTPDDKLHWRPMDEGRCMADMALEVEAIMRYTVDKMANQETGDLRSYMASPDQISSATKDAIVAKLRATCDSLCSAIERVPDDRLEQSIELMPGWVEKIGDLIFLNSGHIDYHNGQCCYVQTLYGDREMRM